MGLQESVGYPAIAFPGQQAEFNQAVYTPENFCSDGTVKPGRFAFAVEVEDEASPAKKDVLYAGLAGEGVVLGLVERAFAGLPDGDGDVYSKGDELTIAMRGDYYIVATAAATVGQSVLCDADGTISFGAEGDAGDTGWYVSKGGEEGEMIIISNHG